MNGAEIGRGALAGASGVVAGVATGVLVAVFAGAAVAYRLKQESPPPLLEATHLPALLTAPGEQVELRYDIHCVSANEDVVDGACPAAGTVFVRSGGAGPFAAVPLRADPDAVDGRFVARVPDAIAESGDGFSYYAVLRSAVGGAELTLPAGGAAAPQRSLPLARSIDVQLGKHRFGGTRKADRRIVEAAWGDGPDEAGLEQDRNLPPMGGASFDVDRTGSVSILDEAHRRLLRWRAGAHTPSQIPLAVNGTLADMSLADDGTIYILESADASTRGGVLRIFAPDGLAKGAGETAERAAQVREGPDGPVLLQQPSGQWMRATEDGKVLDASSQRKSGRAGRPLRGGGEVIVLRRGNEIRAAVVSPNGVRRSWRVTSETDLAEVQLAEAVGNKLVLVVRVYTDDRDDFVVLLLGSRGLNGRFTLDSADWAETAPLSRFRLVGSSLYQLGSTPAGLFVDRFGLEVK